MRRLLSDRADAPARLTPKRGRMERAMRVEWVGQTAASLCGSPGDWLQLCAASAWFLANTAAIVTAEAD